jgi:polysaccharide biosynthesis transport protein
MRIRRLGKSKTLPISQIDPKENSFQMSRWNTTGLDLTIFLQNWMLILIFCAVGGSAVYLASSSQTPIYTATTTLLVRSGESGVSSSLGEIQASREIGRTFKELIKTNSVLEQVRDELGLPYSVNGLRGSISVNVIAGTQLLAVSATDTSPELAADIADTVTQVFIVQREEAGLTEIARLQATLEQYGIFDSADLLATQINSLGGLQIAQSAEVPTAPTSPRPTRDALLGLIAGLGLSLVVVVVLDRLDSQIKSETELATLADAFNIGSVPDSDFPSLTEIFTNPDATSSALNEESFMFLTAKILDHQHQHLSVRDYLVTSLTENEGKTTLSARIAIALASANRQVILADLDLRKPDIAGTLGLESDLGVSTILSGKSSLEESLIDTNIPNLKVLLSGPLPPDPTPLFNNPMMSVMMEDLRAQADIVIYDSAPLKPVPDSWMLMHDVHSCILAVNQPGSSRHEVQAVANRINGTSIRTLCTVLNRDSVQTGVGGYGYGYGYGYGNLNYGTVQDRTGWRKALIPIDRIRTLKDRLVG